MCHTFELKNYEFHLSKLNYIQTLDEHWDTPEWYSMFSTRSSVDRAKLFKFLDMKNEKSQPTGKGE